jgi:hypothetical protein
LRVAGSCSSLTHAHQYAAPPHIASAPETLTAEQSLSHLVIGGLYKVLDVDLLGAHLRLENDLFQNCFQIAHNLCPSFLALLLQRARQPGKTDLVIHAQERQPPLFSEKYLEQLPFSLTQKGRTFRVQLFHRHSAAQAAGTFAPAPCSCVGCHRDGVKVSTPPAYRFPSLHHGLLLASSLFEVIGTGAAGSLGWNSTTAASSVGTSW